MLSGKGIWTSKNKRFSHSTDEAGISRLHSITLTMTSDTYITGDFATTNFNSNTAIVVGGTGNPPPIAAKNGLIKIDFSSMPANSLIQYATLNITPTVDNNTAASVLSVYRILRTVVYSQATNTIYSTANNWGIGGCANSTTDYDGAVLWGSVDIPTNPTLNSPLAIVLDPLEMQKFYNSTYTNNGLRLSMPGVGGGGNDDVHYASTDNATAAYRPYVDVLYY